MTSNANTQLNVIGSAFHHSETILPTAFQHAAVVPAAQTNGAEATDHIGHDIEWVKRTVIGQEALYDFRANAQAKCANKQRQVKRAPPCGVKDPVERD